MAFTVFLSHKMEDIFAATLVASRLKSNQINCYLDSFDPDVKDGPELANYIRRKMQNCNSLMVVASENTVKSWWVPWEIGVATEKDLPLATFSHDYTNVPSYLRKWPYMTHLNQIDLYAETVKRQLITRRILVESGLSRGPVDQLSGHDFNRALKGALGQG